MKKRKLFRIGVMAVLSFFTLTACENSEDLTDDSIEGTYVGSFKEEGNTKSFTSGNKSEDAMAEVTHMGDQLIKVHYYGNRLDTTMVLNYYDHHDSVKVCLTGENFEDEYGHMLGHGHMDGGMMGHMNDSETEWMHHMDEEHEDGDEHFGGFDLNSHTFSFQFKMMNDGVPYHLNFQGKKQ